MNKIKVAWICHFSNPQIRKHLKFDKWTPLALMRKFVGKEVVTDFAQWNTNAISEFEKFDDVELHIVAPHYRISGVQEFTINGVYYHFFGSEDDNISELLRARLTKKVKKSYSRNVKIIQALLHKVAPDIIHMIGAENPYYGESVSIIPSNIPFIVSLQTLMSDPTFLSNYAISQEAYNYRATLETTIIRRADYIGSKVAFFRDIISKSISPTARFLDMSLAVGEDVTITNDEKYYDFVYFAASISKAVDHAIEAFAIAKKKYPNLTLHVVGGYDNNLMKNIQQRMSQLGLGSEVDFTGRLPTHEDVIAEIRKARFAVLPLKIDLISGTIREAMSNGIPVVTTITPATPFLNKNRESILLSEKGDFQAMADNMIRLLSDKVFADNIRRNAVQTMNERCSNATAMQQWREKYIEVIKSQNAYNGNI